MAESGGAEFGAERPSSCCSSSSFIPGAGVGSKAVGSGVLPCPAKPAPITNPYFFMNSGAAPRLTLLRAELLKDPLTTETPVNLQLFQDKGEHPEESSSSSPALPPG